MLKISFIIVILSISLISLSSSVSFKGIVDKVVPSPIRSLFSKETESIDVNDEESKKEHGTLDSVGRDLIKGVSRKINELKNDIQTTFSRVTKGLDCDRSFFSGGSDGFKRKIRAIYPGTKWCGGGDISRSFDDLGKFSDVDSCCREHDICPISIPADETRYGLENTGLFTRSHCDCDQKFYNCLKSANSVVSKSIGFTYFTVLGPQCFKEEYPVTACLTKKKGKCIEYEYNSRGAKLYQWFDSPTF